MGKQRGGGLKSARRGLETRRRAGWRRSWVLAGGQRAGASFTGARVVYQTITRQPLRNGQTSRWAGLWWARCVCWATGVTVTVTVTLPLVPGLRVHARSLDAPDAAAARWCTVSEVWRRGAECGGSGGEQRTTTKDYLLALSTAASDGSKLGICNEQGQRMRCRCRRMRPAHDRWGRAPHRTVYTPASWSTRRRLPRMPQPANLHLRVYLMARVVWPRWSNKQLIIWKPADALPCVHSKLAVHALGRCFTSATWLLDQLIQQPVYDASMYPGILHNLVSHVTWRPRRDLPTRLWCPLHHAQPHPSDELHSRGAQ